MKKGEAGNRETRRNRQRKIRKSSGERMSRQWERVGTVNRQCKIRNSSRERMSRQWERLGGGGGVGEKGWLWRQGS